MRTSGVILAMAAAALGILAAALLEDEDRRRARLADDLAGNAGAGDQRAADGDAVVAADHQHLAEGDRIAGVAGEALELDQIASRRPCIACRRS